jgi:hypothetical protein
VVVLNDVGNFSLRIDSFAVLQDVQLAFQADSRTAYVVHPLAGLVHKLVTVATFEGDQRHKSLVLDFPVYGSGDGLNSN